METTTRLVCTRCGKEKPVTDFQKREDTKRGYYGSCKTCLNKWKRDYAHRPEVRARILKKAPQRNERGRRQRRELRLEVVGALGGKCACCGETKIEFLAIDHIKGRDKEEKNLHGTRLLYAVRNEGYPRSKYRVLCHNCNQALGNLGYCPHETDVDYITQEVT